MRGLPCKTLLLSALLLDAIILLADGLEALLAMQGITPYVTYIFTLWPFSYFSTPVSLVTVRLGLAPPGAASYLLPLLPPLLSTTRRAPQTVPDRSCASHHSAAAHFLPGCRTAPSACAPVPVHGAQCPAETPAARPAPGCTAPRRCCFRCGSMDDNKPHACRSAMRFPVPASAAVFGLPKRCNALRCLPPAGRLPRRGSQCITSHPLPA